MTYEWIQLAQDSEQRRAVENMARNLRVSEGYNILTS